jgi:hypothetical protein
MRDKSGSINGIEWGVTSLGRNVRVTLGERPEPASNPRPTLQATTAAEARALDELADALHEAAQFLRREE